MNQLDPSIPQVEPPVSSKFIESGNFGKTYLSDDNQYAIKVIDLKKKYLNISETIKNEIENYHNISTFCPNYFCPFVGYHYANGFLSITMKYCGTDMYSYLNTAERTPKQKYIIFRKLATALKCLHDNGHIHFDLKPENVVIDKELNVKLIDAGSLTNLLNYTDSKVRIQGTPLYMAPELQYLLFPKYYNKIKANVDKNISPGYINNVNLDKTDIYSYGMMVKIWNPSLFDKEFKNELIHPYPFRRPTIQDILDKFQSYQRSEKNTRTNGGKRKITRRSRRQKRS